MLCPGEDVADAVPRGVQSRFRASWHGSSLSFFSSFFLLGGGGVLVASGKNRKQTDQWSQGQKEGVGTGVVVWLACRGTFSNCKHST